jgi:kynureninase
MTTDPLLVFRAEFPILEKATYLISNSLGAMPQATAGRLQEYAETWATRGVRAWAAWWDMSVTVGDGIAPLIAAPPGTVSMLPNVTTAAAILLSSLEFRAPRNRELNARDVVVDYRPGVGIRMSPHFYTTDEELETAFEVIDEIRESRSWERWRGRPVLVT